MSDIGRDICKRCKTWADDCTCYEDKSCDHSDTDDYTCLDCGKDLMEQRICDAYDRAKAARQDGE